MCLFLKPKTLGAIPVGREVPSAKGRTCLTQATLNADFLAWDSRGGSKAPVRVYTLERPALRPAAHRSPHPCLTPELTASRPLEQLFKFDFLFRDQVPDWKKKVLLLESKSRCNFQQMHITKVKGKTERHR